MPQEVHDKFKDIVLGGAFATRGMESFGDILSEKDVENIHVYLVNKSWQAYRRQQASQSTREPNPDRAEPH
jgi:mono/diheme cytochrome c family protein